MSVWAVGDALVQGFSTQHHTGLHCRPCQKQGHAGREDAAAVALPAGIFFAFPNGSFLRQPPPPIAGSTWLQCWLGSCRRLWLGGQGLRSGTAVLGGDPTHPWGCGHAWGWQHLQELYWAWQQLLLETAPAVPHDPNSPGALGLRGPLGPSPARGVLVAVKRPQPGALPPCFGAAGSPSHRLPRACPLLSGWT